MTQEELNYIKDAFSQIIDDIAGNPDWQDAAKAIASDLGTLERELGERVVSLPSNLDEAAEEYGRNTFINECMENGVCDDHDLSDAFKACAEWMAGQGASFNTKVGWIDGPTILDWPDDILDKFEMGDEVIVQIRRK